MFGFHKIFPSSVSDNYAKLKKIKRCPSMHVITFSRQPIMAEKAGYPCETHYVTTDDGYILQVKSPTSPPKTLSSCKSSYKAATHCRCTGYLTERTKSKPQMGLKNQSFSSSTAYCPPLQIGCWRGRIEV